MENRIRNGGFHLSFCPACRWNGKLDLALDRIIRMNVPAFVHCDFCGLDFDSDLRRAKLSGLSIGAWVQQIELSALWLPDLT